MPATEEDKKEKLEKLVRDLEAEGVGDAVVREFQEGMLAYDRNMISQAHLQAAGAPDVQRRPAPAAEVRRHVRGRGGACSGARRRELGDFAECVTAGIGGGSCRGRTDRNARLTRAGARGD
eukprot:CAMPEP_0179254160 /NCGR_PEP_ID=MMETSP0797-20121207/23101_1 /TAXON_ID=47934 /ORGANISM="Dinophysis acuminata, Strain DAEP01" /LENGTH=120 /DNA_ID=CAMNT_0020962041 /DNA_START=104 /DNA_END=462 /DNA_ORIENTATION=+